MGEYIFQHYVPQFYLREFADENGIIYCYRKDEDRKFPLSRENIQVAGRKEFYDNTDDKRLEKFLSELEGMQSQAYHELCEKTNPNYISEDTKIGILYFVTFQRMRTKRMRDKMEKAVKNVYFSEKDNRNEEDEDLSTEAQEIRDNARELLNTLRTEDGRRTLHPMIIAETAKLFTERLLEWGKMTVFRNKTDIPFCTSDHPVTQYKRSKPEKFDYGNAMGVGGRGWEVHFPLNSNLSLGIIDKRESPYGGTHDLTSKGEVFLRNKLQVANTTEVLICSDEEYSSLQGIV